MHTGVRGLFESWYSSSDDIGIKPPVYDRLSVNHDGRSHLNSPSTHIFHSSGDFHIHTIKLDGNAVLEAVSHNFEGEVKDTMRFTVLTGDSTGTFQIGEYTTAIPLVQSPWVMLGNFKVLVGAHFAFTLEWTCSLSALPPLRSRVPL